MYLEIIYLIYVYEIYLALNNAQWLICNKTKPSALDDRTLHGIFDPPSVHPLEYTINKLVDMQFLYSIGKETPY